MADGATKTCMFCSADVTNAPRMKDAQGRYACKACADKKMAEAKSRGGSSHSATVAVPSAVANYDVAHSGGMDLADVAKTIKGSVQNSKQCPACSAFIPQEAVICITCGHNTLTGKAAKTRLEKALVVKGTSSRRKGGGLNISGEMFAFVVMGIMALLFGLSFIDPMFMIGYMVVAGLYSLAYVILLIVTPFMEGQSVWGICAIASLFLPFFGLAMVYYIFAVSENAALKIMFLAQLLAFVGMVVLFIALGPAAFGGVDAG